MDKPYKRRLPIPNMSEADDRLLGMVVALTSELAVLRERVDTLERVLADGGTITGSAVEDFRPDAGAQAERDAIRQRIIAKVMKPVRDGAARDAELAVSSEVEGDLQ
ncbi:hypothetical protein [Croceicoccus sp. Ery5]|uniref:hypothetical protein n=1 Tax=Croceicoccus sp. Ery5 TaxID=1703340 RepID=UPI001E3886C4|nr:hypothetical protein [Croceicoccus sp. Ery5]